MKNLSNIIKISILVCIVFFSISTPKKADAALQTAYYVNTMNGSWNIPGFSGWIQLPDPFSQNPVVFGSTDLRLDNFANKNNLNGACYLSSYGCSGFVDPDPFAIYTPPISTGSYPPGSTVYDCNSGFDYQGRIVTGGNVPPLSTNQFCSGIVPDFAYKVQYDSGSSCNNNGFCDTGEDSVSCPGDCLGGSGDNFSISLSPSSQTINQSGNATYTITATSIGNMSGDINLSNTYACPNNATCTIWPTTINLIPSGMNNSWLTITTSASTPSSTYTVGVSGSWNGINNTGSANLTISSPASAPAITLTANPTTVSFNGSSVLSWSISGTAPITCTNGANMPAGNWATGSSGSASTGSLTTNTTYTLNCSGPGGNSSNSITINVGSAPVNGACGTANKTYAYSATTYGVDTFCSAGTANPANPSFPAQGGTVPWTCTGQNGGTNASCSANRDTPPPSLTVQVNKAGDGTVVSNDSPQGINCGIDCSETYLPGTTVVLTATPLASRIFVGWTGCDSSTFTSSGGTCTVNVNSSRVVTARFAINPSFKEF